MAERYLAQIILFSGPYTIKGFAGCDGQLLAINTNQALFSLLGITYGGNGTTNFALPDLRGRGPVHFLKGTYDLGAQGGVDAVTPSIGLLPPHQHSYRMPANSAPADQDSPQNRAPAVTPTPTYHGVSNWNQSAIPTQITGGGNPFSVENPNLSIQYQICVAGIFPPRN